MTNFSDKVESAVLDPVWKIVSINMDGAIHTVLRIMHPSLGELNFIVPQHECKSLAAAFTGNMRESEDD